MTGEFVRRKLSTPLGAMVAVAGDAGLVLCEFADRPMLPTQMERIAKICGALPIEGEHPILDRTQAELDEYFAGTREQFSIPLMIDGTPFQMRVWRALLSIPFGKTTSYDSIAMRLDRRGAARAVGRANGDNRIAIIVPCHRVINSDGTMSGYGGGKHRKRWLLDHERRGEQLALV
jgi:AraC family transcriptional regulator, regulatory protein of adaptative response / methylated-DNA-[protein]-cysteine methyltransferase